MTLNKELKNWIAVNAGTGTCFAGSGITFHDADGMSHAGRSGDVLNAFYTAHQVAKDTAVIIAGTNYSQLKVINGGVDIDINDVGWVYANDGGTGSSSSFCKTNDPSVYVCNTPLDGYETDQYGNIRANPACNPCISTWQCDAPYNGWEEDGCGNRRMNADCAPLTNGTLNTDTNPRRAYIIVDGIDSKNTTPAILSLTPGQHRIEYILNGYQNLIKDIDIHQGELIIAVDNLISLNPSSSSGAAVIGLALGATLVKTLLS